jgi:hypothetical protein
MSLLLRRTGVSNYVSNNDGLRQRTSEDAHGRCKEVRQGKRGGTSRRARWLRDEDANASKAGVAGGSLIELP